MDTYYLRNRAGEFISAFGPEYVANLLPDAQEYETREEAQSTADDINRDIENEDDHFEAYVVEDMADL